MANVTVALSGMKEFFTMVEFIYHLWLAILIFGMISNFINITVFLILGDKDHVSTSLLVLSMTDLVYLIIHLFMTVARILVFHFPQFYWTFDPKLFLVCIYWYGQVFYDFSCFVSVFLATLRCCCVVMPLKFKAVFTRTTATRSLTGLFITAVCLRAPLFYAHRLIWKVNPATNKTYLSCASDAKDIQDLTKVNDIVNRNILSTAAYIMVAVCVVTMVVKLRASSRFRNSVSQTSDLTGTNSRPQHAKQGDEDKEQKQHKDPGKMSIKEIHLIQSIILLSVIFLMSQLPFQVYSTIRLFSPEFNSDRSQMFLFGIAGHISTTFSFLNCSVNIFVYLSYNRKYKGLVCSLFTLKKSLSECETGS